MTRGQLLRKYLTPAILTQVSIFLFSIVDGVFTGRGIGTDALGAVNIVFPYIMIFTAVNMMMSIGGMTIAAVSLGRKDPVRARNALMHSFTLSGAVSLLFSLCGILFTRPLLQMLGAVGVYENLGYDYLFWYSVFFVPCGLCYCLSGFTMNDAHPAMVTIMTGVTAALNIFGDWLTIYPLGMGLKGAAIATGISQTVGMFMLLPHFMKKSSALHFTRFRWSGTECRSILLRGLPECVSQIGNPLTILLINRALLSTLGETSVNAFSVISYAASFCIAVFAGTAQGLQPLFGRSYGQKNHSDLRYFLRSGLIIGFIGSILLITLIVTCWGGICDLYEVDELTRSISTYAVPRISWGFSIQSFNVIIAAYLYSTTRTKQSLSINILRGLILNTLIILLLPAVCGPEIIWYTYGIIEALSLVFSVWLLRRSDRKLFASDLRP